MKENSDSTWATAIDLQFSEENDFLIVTTAQNVIDADDGVTSLQEALMYAQVLEGNQTISFAIPDSNKVQLSEGSLLTHNISFDPINKATGNRMEIILDDLEISSRTWGMYTYLEGECGVVNHFENLDIVIAGGNFNSNTGYGSASGGGVFGFVDCNVTISGAVFSENSAYSRGGALLFEDMDLERNTIVIRDSHFEGNNVTGYCGAISFGARNDITIIDTDFLNNTTGYSQYYHWSDGALGIGRGSNLLYWVTDGTVIINTGNDSSCGGFMELSTHPDYPGESSEVEFRVDGSLIIGNGNGEDSFSSNRTASMIPGYLGIVKSGNGIMTINAPTSDYNEAWVIKEGILLFAYQAGGDFEGIVTVHSGAQLDLDANYFFQDLQLVVAKETYLPIISDYGYIQSNRITVNAENAAIGSYKLFGNAAGFNHSLYFLTSDGEEPRELFLNREIVSDEYIYRLFLDSEDNLILRVEDVNSVVRPPSPDIIANIVTPTNQNVTVTAIFSDDTIIKQYSFNKYDWFNYTSPIILSTNGTVHFRGIDAAGNISEISEYTVSNIDRAVPQITVRADNTEQGTRDSVFVSAVFTDNVELHSQEFSLNGTDWFAYSSPIEMEKNGTVWFRAIDTAGNMAQTSYTVSNIAEGPVAPSGTTASLKKYNVTFSWNKYSAKKGVKVKYQIMTDGVIDPKLTSSTQCTLKNATVGNHSFAVRAVLSEKGKEDVYTEWSTDLIQYVADVTAPTLGKVSAEVSGYTGVISWSGTDNVGVEYYEVRCADQVQTVSRASARFENLAVGKYKAEVIAFDAAGNASKTGKVSITVKDATPPEQVTGLAVPVVDSKYKATLSWAPGVDNSGKVVNYEIQLDDGKILKSSKTSINVSKLSVGEHSYKVRAVDKEKNVGEWSEVQTFTVKDMTAPTSVKGKATVDGYSVTFVLSGKDNSGAIAKYIVTSGDKSVETTTETAVLSDFGVGKQTAFIIAYDVEGNASKEAKVSFNVKDATPPEQVTGLEEPLVDSKYKATLSWDPAVDNSGKIASYEIQLDDGKILKSSKTSINVSKLSVGEHSYKVRAIDKDKNVGEWSDSQSFYVQDMTAPGNVSAKASVEENSLLLSWKTPKDNVGVTGYILKHGVNLENEEFLAAEELNYRIDGIAKGTYQYQITAVDDAGNMSKPKTGKVTIKTELPVEEPVLPEPASLNVFDSGAELALASIDDPLAIASNLKLDAEETLSVAELTGQDTTNSNRLQLFTAAS